MYAWIEQPRGSLRPVLTLHIQTLTTQTRAFTVKLFIKEYDAVSYLMITRAKTSS